MQVKSHETATMRGGSVLAGWALRTASWLLLGGWFGSWTLFAWVIAPTAFQVLPSQEVAGTLVAPVLGALHKYGIGAGVLLGGLAALRRSGRLAIAAPLLLAGFCAFSQYAVTPSIEEVSARSFGESQNLDAAARFSRLHELSRTLFGIVELGVIALIAREAWESSPQRRAS